MQRIQAKAISARWEGPLCPFLSAELGNLAQAGKPALRAEGLPGFAIFRQKVS